MADAAGGRKLCPSMKDLPNHRFLVTCNAKKLCSVTVTRGAFFVSNLSSLHVQWEGTGGAKTYAGGENVHNATITACERGRAWLHAILTFERILGMQIVR